MKGPFTTTAICLLIGISLVGCGNGGKNPGSASEQPIATAGAATGDAEAAAAIMDKPMDGSSAEAFTRDLEAVKAAASPEDFQALESALGFIRFYEFGGAGYSDQMYQSLNGMTPRQIIERGKK